ncbi:MAG: DUF4224 domain-containing protein [Candidatus Thiodiazotropha sp. (ex Semelilucina semeliformis)]|nr:DUF4224 domain-containing protein [Candidatus Thiodiazotropha sp. (ex Semelilucina semeliformis)]
MDESTITYERLQELTGYERPSELKKCLKSQGITFLRGKAGHPFTTLTALNRAMGIDNTQKDEPHEEIYFR